MNYKHEVLAFPEKIPAKIWNQDMLGPEMFTPSHWHRSLEMDLVIDGRMSAVIHGRHRILNPGDFLFANSGDLHEIDYVHPSDHLLAVTLMISYDFVMRWFPDYENFYFDVDGHLEVQPHLKVICRKIGEVYRVQDRYYELELISLLCQMLHLLITRTARKRPVSPSHGSQCSSENIRKAITFINSNYQQKITLDMLADYVGFSSSYFSRFFRQQTGMGFSQYLAHIRLHAASRDLINRGASSTQCALDNGFPNVKSFIEAFKKAYHCTPSHYKKQLERVSKKTEG